MQTRLSKKQRRLYLNDNITIMSKKQWLEHIKKNSYNGMFMVNNKYRPQLKDHAVLRKLIKSRVLKVVREGLPKCKRTYLVLDEYSIQESEG